jgi:hypothetical protein
VRKNGNTLSLVPFRSNSSADPLSAGDAWRGETNPITTLKTKPIAILAARGWLKEGGCRTPSNLFMMLKMDNESLNLEVSRLRHKS